MKNRGHLLVTGSMRSGTTYVGKVLAHCPSLFYIHEPFNATRGIEGVEHWLPYWKTPCPEGTYAGLVDRLMDQKVAYTNPDRDSVWRRWARSIIGSRPAWRIRLYRWWLHRRRNMLIKDPTAVFVSHYMVQHHGVNALLLVRHPMAFYYSFKRLGWDFNLDNIRSQSALVQEHLTSEDQRLLNEETDHVQKLALLWRIIYRVAGQFAREEPHSEQWIVCRHEDICRDPRAQFEKVVRAFDYEYTEKMDRLIGATSSGANPVKADNNQTHQMNRDSSRLATYWKGMVSREEVDRVREITQPVAAQYYDDTSWSIDPQKTKAN